VSVTYTAVLDVSEDGVAFLSGLLEPGFRSSLALKVPGLGV
jgi:hypothetical protein